ncbi:hypothetical protein H6G80_17155 [Nostoc sp. FACHB-87]|uniref:hypothetical protein n=1 Tax=Nostocales TaxID=1161 RepID=UPI0016847ABB|nr:MULTISPECIES: hypothetical protein [Nostocales]MBD2455802.1 hypothetical protein [Nostoc sp. FACHB-87]MBD2477145.1 hypothetical protein [Anabaena sp. FACHB-83]MBD2486040.1 hypothetical protein [Aulosira sp. FACHB-615]
MLQVWLNRLWKLFFIVILSITILVPGNSALAANLNEVILGKMVIGNSISMPTPIIMVVGTLSQIRVTSIKNTSNQPGEVTIIVQGASVQQSKVMSMKPGDVLPLNLDTCFGSTTTVKFDDAVTDTQTQKTLFSASFAKLTSQSMNLRGYTIDYQISPQTCP